MPWKENRLGAMREKFVKRVLAHEKKRANYAVSTESAAQPGINEYPAICPENKLEDRSRAPKIRPNKTEAELENEIVGYRKCYPAIGATKIRRIMETDGYTDLPSTQTFNDSSKMASSQKKSAKPLHHINGSKSHIQTRYGRRISKDIFDGEWCSLSPAEYYRRLQPDESVL